MLFGKLLRTIRKKKGYTSQQVADAIYVSRSTYSRYENDLKPVEPESLDALVEFYETTVEDFLMWRDVINDPAFPFNIGKLKKEGILSE